MKKWLVGGSVRDALLGRPVNDHDWVVVGASPQDLLDLGYQPVGKDFPVFLHPRTKEEVALARTERKTAPGYHGFVFHADANVTLEDDLQRRDLTINAMAQDEDGRIVDPYHGRADLDRLVSMWTQLLAASGGPMLFGHFTIADAFFAPVVTRLVTYGAPVPAAVKGYIDRVLALRSVSAWYRDATAEQDFLQFEENYRTGRT